MILEGWDKDPGKRPSAAAVAKRWIPYGRRSASKPKLPPAPAVLLIEEQQCFVLYFQQQRPATGLTDDFEGKSLVTFSDPLNLPAQPPVQSEQKLQPRSSGLPESPQSPKSVSTGAHEEPK